MAFILLFIAMKIIFILSYRWGSGKVILTVLSSKKKTLDWVDKFISRDLEKQRKGAKWTPLMSIDISGWYSVWYTDNQESRIEIYGDNWTFYIDIEERIVE